MDSLKDKNVLVIAATNRPDLLDRAMLRPGRFDLRIELPMPDAESRKEIFRIHAGRLKLGSDVNLDDFAERSEGFSGADIEALCRMAGINALREAAGNNADSFTIEARHFAEAWQDVAGNPENVG